MATYRYVTTNILTGRVLADTLPLRVTDFASNLGTGQPGQLRGSLTLPVLTDAQAAAAQAAYIGALEPERSMLWVLQDGLPIWVGPVWDWPHTSAAANQLPIQAEEIWSLFLRRREIRADQTFAAGTDIFTVIRALLTYATTGKGASGVVAGLTLGTSLSGITLSAPLTVAATNLPKVGAVVAQLTAQYGIEATLAPGLDSNGNLVIRLLLGAPTIGRPAATTGLQLRYPGAATDYGYPRAGAASTNSLIATASASGGVSGSWSSNPATHGLNSAALAAGYPLLEDSYYYSTTAIATQAQIDAVADGRLPAVTGTRTIPTVTIGGGAFPAAGQVQLGDEAYLIATSTLHPAAADGSPGLEALVRIIGWKVSPGGDGTAETTDYLLGGIST